MPHTKSSKHTRRSIINVSTHENSGIARKKPRIVHRVSFLENCMENVRFSERERIVSDSRVITCDSRISQYLELVNNVRTYLNVLLNVIGNMLKESQLSQMLHVEWCNSTKHLICHGEVFNFKSRIEFLETLHIQMEIGIPYLIMPNSSSGVHIRPNCPHPNYNVMWRG